ncbi:Flavin-dependent tryptophan halogenase RebH [Paraurantiacibacter namhicola]|uniref:Flavin-dependent tryptophan halogenase RebH n=1 Tax=Paraurantiacibacter namhicola TaxID=645517 RepID=A0A1C7D6S8_9SPHN|nr:Flavin-dependent tryptophan halogenase RebH [Paraurantiacibacter namhicola]
MSAKGKPSIVIAGGGTAGWMAAAALARFASATHDITLVESEAIGTVGVGEATIPQIHNFNHALGLDEAAFVSATQASFKLGIEFAGWSGDGSAYMHAFGPVGRAHGPLPFQHYWLRAADEGDAGSLAEYSLNEQAARAGKFRRGPSRSGGAAMPYAYHFDAALYAAHLREYAEARGVTRVEGRIDSVAKHGESGHIRALHLDGGTQVVGDFFIDCTGFRALLIGEAMGTDFDAWDALLPCDRAIAAPCAKAGAITPYTRATARPAGWQWRIPLQHRTGNGHVFCSQHMGEDEATQLLLDNLDGEPTADPRTIRFQTGKRREHWRGNCLALGLAAGFMEPLESTSIHLVQSAIARFLPLLPGAVPAQAAIDRFNADADTEWLAIRDFLVLHYRANAREGEPFWDAMRGLALPDTLTSKIALWQQTGTIHRAGDELFAEVGWLQVLAGQGVMARAHNPIADAMPKEDLARFLAQQKQAIAADLATMPTHEAAIADLTARHNPSGVAA